MKNHGSSTGRAIGRTLLLGLLSTACSALVGADFDGLTSTAKGRGEEAADPGAPSASSPGAASSGASSSGGPGGDAASSSNGSGGSSVDASTKRCVGIVPDCRTFTSSSACGALAGCLWTTPQCAVITDCAAIKTSTQCEETPGCQVDVIASKCKPRTSGYCFGTNRAQCEATSGCRFTGGCTGVAMVCGDIADEAACVTQQGCAWE